MITVDGHEWDVPCGITRVAEMTPSEVSGLMLDKSYFNDVVGTYLRYEVSLAVPANMTREYLQLYRTLVDPVDGHEFILPYGDDEITVTARVDELTDEYVYVSGANQYWKGVKFTLKANHPTYTYTLDEMIARGLTPLPDVGGAAEGDMYTLVDGEWVYTEFTNADNVSY